jgi:hypothetical protein
VLDSITRLPELEALWQLHFSEEGGTAHNAPAEYIANLPGPDAGNYIELSAGKNGSFSVFNSRTNSTKTWRRPKK